MRLADSLHLLHSSVRAEMTLELPELAAGYQFQNGKDKNA